MTKITGDIEQDFAAAGPTQRRDLLLKLQRYIDRGAWASAIAARLAERYGAQGVLSDEPAQKPQDDS